MSIKGNSNVFKLGTADVVPELKSAAGDLAMPVHANNGTVMLILFSTNKDTFTLKGNNSMFGADVKIPVEANTSVYFYTESGPFVQLEGEDKGHIVISSSNGTGSAALIELQ